MRCAASAASPRIVTLHPSGTARGQANAPTYGDCPFAMMRPPDIVFAPGVYALMLSVSVITSAVIGRANASAHRACARPGDRGCYLPWRISSALFSAAKSLLRIPCCTLCGARELLHSNHALLVVTNEQHDLARRSEIHPVRLLLRVIVYVMSGTNPHALQDYDAQHRGRLLRNHFFTPSIGVRGIMTWVVNSSSTCPIRAPCPTASVIFSVARLPTCFSVRSRRFTYKSM